MRTRPQDEITKHNEAIYAILCKTSFGNEYDRLLIYATSIIKEAIQGINGGCFSYDYIKEKVDKLDSTALDISRRS